MNEKIGYFSNRVLGVQKDIQELVNRAEISALDPDKIELLAITCEKAAQSLRGINREIGEYLSGCYGITPQATETEWPESEQELPKLQLTKNNAAAVLAFEKTSRDVKIVEAIELASSLYHGGKRFVRLLKEINK